MKKIEKKFLAVLLFAVFLTGICLTGCGQLRPHLKEYNKQYLDYFDTFSSITIYAENEKQFQEYETIVHNKLKQYHQLFDIYEEYDGIANLCTINADAGLAHVTVESEILELLERSEMMYDLTGGKVNPALGSVLQIWHKYRTEGTQRPEKAELPDMEILQEAAKHTDIHDIEIDKEKHTVYLPDEAMQLDAGAVAKGYTAHKICEDLRAAGVTSALINLGGNVQTIGTKPNGKPWRVGVQNPDTGSEMSYLHAVRLQDMALVTSGSYQRFYEVDGKRYHHIIDTDTLMPKDTFAGVTILCEDGMMADALSTALFNMELDEGQKLIESLDGTEAIWVYPDGEEVWSFGFEKFVDD
ncbi:MAG: FAD:protein FMN transferase [Brotaphodocola sp.]